ncbi:hypothetical protein [Phreatobacter sp. AB_2022a]|uniref:hypothetical protein n=1 Tax=Phreatobacter sp. AB_2022a TaxID=3003134 RepID=UPI000579ADED|nr:hypothetical protein [Phreatobacter sp. AB_2022a]MCZ0734705.1 hypothetical protein [Phreatobacter sp. AB_2022a]CEJ10913.1 hypothetical protein BN1110_01199 [bacterium YEK0313]
MTFGSVKSLIRAVDGDFVRVDGSTETARFFLPAPGRRIEIAARGVTVTRRTLKPRARVKRFIRVS